MLQAIGFWCSLDDASLIHPNHLVDHNWRSSDRAMLVQYLRSASSFCDYLGYSSCRFQCGIEDHDLGDSGLTDGVWCWPSGLAHYVEQHHIRLPNEFANYAEAADWKPKQIPKAAPDYDDMISADDFANIGKKTDQQPQCVNESVARYDLSFWRSWCYDQVQS